MLEWGVAPPICTADVNRGRRPRYSTSHVENMWCGSASGLDVSTPSIEAGSMGQSASRSRNASAYSCTVVLPVARPPRASPTPAIATLGFVAIASLASWQRSRQATRATLYGRA